MVKVFQFSSSTLKQHKESLLMSTISALLSEKERVKSSFYLKKILYLGSQLEEADYSKDGNRLHLLAHQLFNDIQNDIYYLNFKEFCGISALFLYIKYQAL